VSVGQGGDDDCECLDFDVTEEKVTRLERVVNEMTGSGIGVTKIMYLSGGREDSLSYVSFEKKFGE